MSLNLFSLDLFLPYVFDRCFEGDGEGGDGEGGDGGAGTATQEETFTKAEVDDMMAKARQEHREKLEKNISKLKTIEAQSKTTQEERDSLRKQISELEDSLLSEKELQAKKEAEQRKKYETDLDEAKQAGKIWEERFIDSTNQRALLDAANSEKALNASQIVAMYGPVTTLERDKDEDGELLNTFTSYLSFEGLNKKKEKEQMKLPVKEAIKKIKEDGLNNNLFEHTAAPGTGASPNSGSGSGTKPGEEPVRDDFASDQEYLDAYKKHTRG